MQLIDQTSAAQFIRAMAPECTWLLRHIESEDGYVRFPPLFSQIITNLKIEHYPELYENEAFIGAMMLRAFMSPEEINTFNTEFEALSLENRGKFIVEAIREFETIEGIFNIPKTIGEQKRAEAVFNALSEDEKKEATRFWQYFMMALLAGFYQSLAVMVHGEKLTSLVAQAKAGDDKAFAKAVQIDKRILLAIPHFKKRFADANIEGDHKFTEDVAAHLQRPPYKGKIRHKVLYLAFAFLDQVGLLDTMSHKEILDLVNDAGIDAHANRIDDVKNLSKRLDAYRKFQHNGLTLSTP